MPDIGYAVTPTLLGSGVAVFDLKARSLRKALYVPAADLGVNPYARASDAFYAWLETQEVQWKDNPEFQIELPYHTDDDVTNGVVTGTVMAMAMVYSEYVHLHKPSPHNRLQNRIPSSISKAERSVIEKNSDSRSQALINRAVELAVLCWRGGDL